MTSAVCWKFHAIPLLPTILSDLLPNASDSPKKEKQLITSFDSTLASERRLALFSVKQAKPREAKASKWESELKSLVSTTSDLYFANPHLMIRQHERLNLVRGTKFHHQFDMPQTQKYRFCSAPNKHYFVTSSRQSRGCTARHQVITAPVIYQWEYPHPVPSYNTADSSLSAQGDYKHQLRGCLPALYGVCHAWKKRLSKWGNGLKCQLIENLVRVTNISTCKTPRQNSKNYSSIFKQSRRPLPFVRLAISTKGQYLYLYLYNL